MKTDKIKFSIFCLVIFAIVSLPVSQIALAGFVPDNSAIYSFYTVDNISAIKNANIVKNGNSLIVSCDSKNASIVRNSIINVLGESVQFTNPNNSTLNKINNYLKDKLLHTETVGKTEIKYAYDQTLLRYVMVDGKKVNLQVATNGNLITIGYPLILGSF